MIRYVKKPGVRTQGHKGHGDDPDVGWDKELTSLVKKRENLERREAHVMATLAQWESATGNKVPADQAAQPAAAAPTGQRVNVAHGNPYTIWGTLTGAFADIFGPNGALDRAICASVQEDEKGGLGAIRASKRLRCYPILTLDKAGKDETIVQCRPPSSNKATRKDFVLTKWTVSEGGVDVTHEYPAQLQAIFSLMIGGAVRPYVVLRTMTKPIPHHPNAVMPFAKTQYDQDGRLWVAPAGTIVSRATVVPTNLMPSLGSIEDHPFYVYPEHLPDVLA